MQQAVKYYSLESYMLRPNSLLTKLFEDNNKAQENIFSHMCNLGAQKEWRNGTRDVSYYFYVETRKHQYSLLNPKPVDSITGYIMEDYVCYMYLRRPPQICLHLIDGSISDY